MKPGTLPGFLTFPNLPLQALAATYVGVASCCGGVIAGRTPTGVWAGLLLLIAVPVAFLAFTGTYWVGR